MFSYITAMHHCFNLQKYTTNNCSQTTGLYPQKIINLQNRAFWLIPQKIINLQNRAFTTRQKKILSSFVHLLELCQALLHVSMALLHVFDGLHQSFRAYAVHNEIAIHPM